jgi:MarR family transcriptional regulator for hemolysin
MENTVDFGILLGLAFQTFSDELRAELATQGFDDLGGAYGLIFRALAREPLLLTELAEWLGMTAQGASKIISEMEARKYVERQPDPEDGRAKRLRLGPRGRAALACARKFHAGYEQRLCAELGERNVASVRRVLGRMLSRSGKDPANTLLRAF